MPVCIYKCMLIGLKQAMIAHVIFYDSSDQDEDVRDNIAKNISITYMHLNLYKVDHMNAKKHANFQDQ